MSKPADGLTADLSQPENSTLHVANAHEKDDTRQECLRVDGFYDEIIGASLETKDFVTHAMTKR